MGLIFGRLRRVGSHIVRSRAHRRTCRRRLLMRPYRRHCARPALLPSVTQRQPSCRRLALGTAAQASAGSRMSDGNAQRAAVRTHGAPPQERQIARSVTRARALLAASSARSHPTCRHHSDTADVHTCPRRENPGQHNVTPRSFGKPASRRTPRTRCVREGRASHDRELDQIPCIPTRARRLIIQAAFTLYTVSRCRTVRPRVPRRCRHRRSAARRFLWAVL